MGNRAVLDIAPRFPEHAEILGTIKPETLWSCMQCMACVEICPVGIEHVPIINQMRRALVERGEMDGAAAADAGDDLHVRQLLRRGQAQARPLGEGPRLRRQGRTQGAGRAPLVRRRLRLLRSAQPADQPGARARSSATPASTSGSSTTASERPGTTSAARARKASGRRSPRRTSRRSRAAASTASSPPTRTPSTRSRTSTRSSAATGRWSTTPSSCSSCWRRGACGRARASATASPTTTRARSGATTASTTSRGR